MNYALHMAVAVVVEFFFFLFLACLIGAGIAELIKKPRGKPKPKPMYPWWWEFIRGNFYQYKLNRLQSRIFRKLTRHQERAERWQRNHLD